MNFIKLKIITSLTTHCLVTVWYFCGPTINLKDKWDSEIRVTNPNPFAQPAPDFSGKRIVKIMYTIGATMTRIARRPTASCFYALMIATNSSRGRHGESLQTK